MRKNSTSSITRRRNTSDPLAAALLPPPNETEEERYARLEAETEAKKKSDSIDEMIQKDRKKSRNEVKVLLLGQSESGKSTTLKQFQLLHTPSAFHKERIAWRAVIYLNLVRSIRRILDALLPEETPVEDHEDLDSLEPASIIISSNGRPPSAISGTKVSNYELYRRRLEPLVALEERLTHLLSSPADDEPVRLGKQPVTREGLADDSSPSSPRNGRPTPTIVIPNHDSSRYPVTPVVSPAATKNRKNKEVTVQGMHNWKKPFYLDLGSRSKSPKNAHSNEIEGWWEDPNDPCHTLNACAQTMIQLWQDPQVRKRLEEKRLRLEESSGFFLDEIPRITAKMFIPRDEDVLKARLKTMGVVEHTFLISSGTNRGVEWKIYDVGGARHQRQAWAPYFDDVNAIIFLAPISAFDQVLAEDPRVNRLEDSLLLWKSLVSTKLLSNVNIMLFLNKCDLLRAKLDTGVRLNQHMLSYGDRSNDYDSVSNYFRNKFGALHQNFTPNRERELYIHFTSVTDTRRTSLIISNVRDIIIKANLRSLKLV